MKTGVYNEHQWPFCCNQTEASVRNSNVNFKKVATPTPLPKFEDSSSNNYGDMNNEKRLIVRESMNTQENKIVREPTRIRTDFRQMIQDNSDKMKHKRDIHVRDTVHALPSQLKRKIHENCPCSPKPTEFRQMIHDASKKMNNKNGHLPPQFHQNSMSTHDFEVNFFDRTFSVLMF